MLRISSRAVGALECSSHGRAQALEGVWLADERSGTQPLRLLRPLGFGEAAGDVATWPGCAREAGIGPALGTCTVEADRGCHSQLRFYLPDGTYLGFHSKTLTWGTWEDPPQGEINDYGVAPLRTYNCGGICVGGLICNDLWANPGCTPVPDPHLSQLLARMGARILFHAVNGGRGHGAWSRVAWQYHEANLRMRARAGRVWVVTVDNCHPMDIPCSAPCGVVDPNGDWVCQTEPQGERYYAYTIAVADDPACKGAVGGHAEGGQGGMKG
jgi:predicted amidohydrolase